MRVIKKAVRPYRTYTLKRRVRMIEDVQGRVLDYRLIRGSLFSNAGDPRV